ncbi:MAG: GNAT family N-acetyltransferase, partial [Lachnospiraceae bacterium]|nr:GNAT family N-acetyltransferase [Lachnospiraceae bacterium]
MEKLILISPTSDYAQDLTRFRTEIEQVEDADSFAGCSQLENYDRVEDWIKYVYLNQFPENVCEGRVPSNVYLALRETDKKIVGIIDLRHHIQHPILGLWGGHIGYTIRPCERGKGYAKEMLRLNLENAKKLGLKKVMITCHPDNPASEKTILANGGVYEKTVEVDG